MDRLLLIGQDFSKEDEILRFLQREGYELVFADDGAAGLKKLTEEKPQVVIVDHAVDDDSGIRVLKEVRKTDPACEVVLVTPGGEMEAAIEVLRAGALDYLRRPVDVNQLRVALGRAHERKRQRKTAEPSSILVLEDHETTLKRLVRVLEKEGYRVLSASNGEDGLKLFREHRCDLILADVKMPLKDGLDVLRETKGAGADVEVIVVTGYGDEDVVVQALRDGAINFLKKPIDIEQMLLAIQKALDFQTMRRSLAYRNRDVEIMQELVVRLTRELELIIEAPEEMGLKAREFLHQLMDALPIGIVVVSSDRKILYANKHVVSVIGESPILLSTDWLKRMGVAEITEENLENAFSSAVKSRPGSVETLFLSKWAFLVMTSLKMVRPDLTERYVALAIRGERQMQSSPPTQAG